MFFRKKKSNTDVSRTITTTVNNPNLPPLLIFKIIDYYFSELVLCNLLLNRYINTITSVSKQWNRDYISRIPLPEFFPFFNYFACLFWWKARGLRSKLYYFVHQSSIEFQEILRLMDDFKYVGGFNIDKTSNLNYLSLFSSLEKLKVTCYQKWNLNDLFERKNETKTKEKLQDIDTLTSILKTTQLEQASPKKLDSVKEIQVQSITLTSTEYQLLKKLFQICPAFTTITFLCSLIDFLTLQSLNLNSLENLKEIQFINIHINILLFDSFVKTWSKNSKIESLLIKCCHMHTVDPDFNQPPIPLTQEQMTQFISSIFSINNLKTLVIEEGRLSPTFIQLHMVQEFFEQNQQLERFTAKNIPIKSFGVLEKRFTVQHPNLSNLYLDFGACKKDIIEFGPFEKLTNFHLESCVTGSNLQSIKHLKTLVIQKCSGALLVNLNILLKETNCLETFELHHQLIQSEDLDLDLFLNAIQQNRTLSKLNIWNTQFSTVFITNIFKMNHPTIQNLLVQCTTLPKELTLAMSQNKSILRLTLGIHQRINSYKPEIASIFDIIQQNTTLTHLDISSIRVDLNKKPVLTESLKKIMKHLDPNVSCFKYIVTSFPFLRVQYINNIVLINNKI